MRDAKSAERAQHDDDDADEDAIQVTGGDVQQDVPPRERERDDGEENGEDEEADVEVRLLQRDQEILDVAAHHEEEHADEADRERRVQRDGEAARFDVVVVGFRLRCR